jgi:hypothetical protein
VRRCLHIRQAENSRGVVQPPRELLELRPSCSTPFKILDMLPVKRCRRRCSMRSFTAHMHMYIDTVAQAAKSSGGCSNSRLLRSRLNFRNKRRSNADGRIYHTAAAVSALQTPLRTRQLARLEAIKHGSCVGSAEYFDIISRGRPRLSFGARHNLHNQCWSQSHVSYSERQVKLLQWLGFREGATLNRAP